MRLRLTEKVHAQYWDNFKSIINHCLGLCSSNLICFVVFGGLSANLKYFVLSTTSCLVWRGYWFYRQFPSGLVTEYRRGPVKASIKLLHLFSLKAAFPRGANLKLFEIVARIIKSFITVPGLPYHTFSAWTSLSIALDGIRYNVIVYRWRKCNLLKIILFAFPRVFTNFRSLLGFWESL